MRRTAGCPARQPAFQQGPGSPAGSAIAILVGLVLAWAGGTVTGGSNGLADVTVLGVAVQLRGASAGREGDTSRARGEPGTTMTAVRIRGSMR